MAPGCHLYVGTGKHPPFAVALPTTPVSEATGAFTTHAGLIIVGSERFILNGQTYRFGKAGDSYRLNFEGKRQPPMPFFMGYTMGLHLRGGNDETIRSIALERGAAPHQ
jgi:hypothetical protein